MPDELKKFLQGKLEVLKQNKIRVIAVIVCFVFFLAFWLSEDDFNSEEIILNDKPPLTKDLPVKPLPVERKSDGVKIVLGANADELFIGDPFAGEDKPKPKPQPPKPVVEPVPQIVIQPPPQPLIIEQPKPQEKIILVGTAISGDNKTAMFLREKETLFLTVGEEISGKKISDISVEFVTFEDGQRAYMQKELR